MHRHENGVTKNRKTPLTGSGRAWREDEVRDALAIQNLEEEEDKITDTYSRKRTFFRLACKRCPTSTLLPI